MLYSGVYDVLMCNVQWPSSQYHTLWINTLGLDSRPFHGSLFCSMYMYLYVRDLTCNAFHYIGGKNEYKLLDNLNCKNTGIQLGVSSNRPVPHEGHKLGAVTIFHTRRLELNSLDRGIYSLL